METKIIEASNGTNWGKFLLGRFDTEWSRVSRGDQDLKALGWPLLRIVGWTREFLLVLDLQTGEGALFRAGPGGYAPADLKRHAIWVCPLFEPFLSWLYTQDLADLGALPDAVTFTPQEAPFALQGYRRPGEHCTGCGRESISPDGGGPILWTQDGEQATADGSVRLCGHCYRSSHPNPSEPGYEPARHPMDRG